MPLGFFAIFFFFIQLSTYESFKHTRKYDGSFCLYSNNKRTSGTNMGIPQKISKNIPLSDVVRRRKVGPPQRASKSYPEREEALPAGRVSVYCLGAGLDLQALRAQVFRKVQKTESNSNSTEAEDPSSHKRPFEPVSKRSLIEEVDEEMLHVSNAPLFISIENRSNYRSKADSSDRLVSSLSRVDSVASQLLSDDVLSTRGSELDIDDRGSVVRIDEDDISDTEWKTRETLLMATQDIFYFDYGCVVFWGLSTREEKAAIAELSAFTIDAVSPTEQSTSYDTMEYVFDRKANPQRPIRFDRMRLRSLQLEEKMALSYAMAQSSKLFVFESRVLDSVEMTRYLPKELAKNGRIDSSKKALNQQIGELFVEQTEVNLFSSILDTPDFLWDNDEHLPAYQYTRSYLEVDDRVALLNSRLAVIRDLLDVLTGQVADSNSTRLEWIVIWLISVEIVMGIASNPLFVGKRVLVSMLVPVCIIAYKRVNWAKVFKDL
jgi:uncharacterized Rmd1/YagE family protein